ncbi:MAG: hypothetical protein ACRD5K_13660 [Candidatus Acidiferrales bacterium]
MSDNDIVNDFLVERIRQKGVERGSTALRSDRSTIFRIVDESSTINAPIPLMWQAFYGLVLRHCPAVFLRYRRCDTRILASAAV